MSTTHCVLMCALPGAGKTTLALALAEHGCTRLCPDEEMLRRHGRRGIDFDRREYLVLERPILDEMAVQLHELLTAGRDVVLDHGLWTPAERAEWRSLAGKAGAVPLLVYLPVPHDVRWERIRARNQLGNVPAEFSEHDLIRYADRFQPPDTEEPHFVYDGRPQSVLSALRPP